MSFILGYWHQRTSIKGAGSDLEQVEELADSHSPGEWPLNRSDGGDGGDGGSGRYDICMCLVVRMSK